MYNLDSLIAQAKPCTSCWKSLAFCVFVLSMLAVALTPGLAQAAATQPADRAVATRPANRAVPTTKPTTMPTTGPAPKLRCDEPIYNFGEVWSGEKVEHDFIFHNDGAGTLKITRVQATCGCTATKYDKTIEPGQTGRVHTTLSARSPHPNLKKLVYVFTDDPHNKKFTITLQGKVKTRIEMEPSAGARFGVVKSTPVEPIIVKLTNNTSTPMKIEPSKNAKEHEIFKTSIKEIEPGKVYTVTITAQEPFTPGKNYYARMPFSTGIKEQSQVLISCRLSMPLELEISRRSMMLGSPPQRNVPQHTDITYNGKGQLNVISAKSTHEKVQPVIDTLEPGRRYRVAWTLPKGLDITSDKPIHIKIATDYEKQPEIDIPIRVRPPRPPRSRMTSKTAESLIGQQTPRVAVKALDGKYVQLGTGDGKVWVVNFWASYCRYSRRQLPMLQRIGSIYRHRGVEFLMVSLDEQRPANEIGSKAKQLGVDLTIGLDTNHRVSSRFGVNGRCPTMLLIGKSGKIEAVHRGMPAGIEDLILLERQITAELDVLLEGQMRTYFPKAPSIISEITTIEEPGQMMNRLAEVPLLSVESSSQDTGSHKPGALVQYNLYYRNDGKSLLTITNVSGDEGMKINPGYPKKLQTTMSGAIKIEFNAPKTPGEFRRRVTISSNSLGNSPMNVIITGATLPFIQADPPAVDFSGTPRLHAMPRLVMLTYNGEGQVKYLEAESNSPKFEAKVQAIEGTPYAKLTVKSKPPFEIGETRSVIRIKTDCPQQPVLELPVVLLLHARVEINPAAVVLPDTPERQLQNQILITNHGERPLHILGATPSNEKIKTLFHPLPDGKSYKLLMTFPVGYQPASASKGDKVTIRTDDDAEYKEIVIPIQVQYR